ncbi:protein ENDOSPERM DEFECTIVE 1-like [Salvia hispanica]|uniref:protein ENDOSPERM DEFECTIVE 1-like n=1 Tax=Salvia hispanica TaxID=49212 RepID=UPI002009D6B1|nr:protein ENDOSPERM DEFECTIVE 1-like [Salvia hispanica]
MEDLTGGAASSPPPPPPTQRRPRVREVSSRFMSPLVQSNSTPHPSNFPRAKSAHRRNPSKNDENFNPEPNHRGLDKLPTPISTIQRKQHQQRLNSKDHHLRELRVSSRPDTPMAIERDRIVPSRFRQSVSRSNSLSSSSDGCSAVTAAARLLQEATSDAEKRLSRISTSSYDDSASCTTATASNQRSSSCPNSPHCAPVTKLRSARTDVRSSVPDMDRNLENSGKDCARSLNFSSLSKIGGGGVSLPPHPSSLNSRKGRKVSNHQDEVHSLKMMINHSLQYRFANAKAEASLQAQKQETERNFCSLGAMISDKRDIVKKKRIELAVLRKLKTLNTIVEAQMPYLEDWSSMEVDYSNCLSGAANALLSSSVRLPVSGDVRADAGEIEEALTSASKVVESINSQIQRFAHMAEGIDTLVSEVSRMANGEKALTKECGYLLSKTYSSQVIECSLRGALMQFNDSNNHPPHKSEE